MHTCDSLSLSLSLLLSVCVSVCTDRRVCVRARARERVSASRNRYRPVECLGEDWTRKRRLGGGRIGCVGSPSPSRARLPTPSVPLALSLCVNEPGGGAQARCRVSLHRARINTPAGAYFRPRNLNFCTPRVVPGHLIFDLSPPPVLPAPIGDERRFLRLAGPRFCEPPRRKNARLSCCPSPPPPARGRKAREISALD